MNLGSLTAAHDSKSLANPPSPNSILALSSMTVDSTVGSIGSGVGSSVYVSVTVTVGTTVDVAGKGVAVFTISVTSLTSLTSSVASIFVVLTPHAKSNVKPEVKISNCMNLFSIIKSQQTLYPSILTRNF